MTESQWLSRQEPLPMLDNLPGKVNKRKLRLFAVACCRHIWHMITDERSRDAVDVAEGYADGLADGQQLHDAFKWAGHVTVLQHISYPAEAAAEACNPDLDVARVSWYSIGAIAQAACSGLPSSDTASEAFDAYHEGLFEGGIHQSSLLRDVIGNPFRPVTIAPAWLTPDVVMLAQAIYEDRAFDRMQILGDALEGAGCDNADILAHCRSQEEHVRGCWVVDALLGNV